MKKTTPPILRHIANLWSLCDYPTARKPWSLERQIVAVKEAGFDGFTGLIAVDHGRLAEKHDLIVVGYFGTAKSSELRKLIQRNRDAGAVHINVQLADHDTPVEESIKLGVKLMEEGEKLGIKCAIEIHRDTCTETPEKTYAIAAGYKKATGQEKGLNLPLAAAMKAQYHKMVALGWPDSTRVVSRNSPFRTVVKLFYKRKVGRRTIHLAHHLISYVETFSFGLLHFSAGQNVCRYRPSHRLELKPRLRKISFC